MLFLGALLLAGRPAATDCSGPTIDYGPLVVARGAAVTVVGSGFGDKCYDTGPPPAGQGVLGKPLTNIEIHIAQDRESWLVGRGAAGPDYTFDVEIVVPDDLRPGEASVTVRVGEFLVHDLTNRPLTITDVSPEERATTNVASFGPSPAATTRPPTDSRIESTASTEPTDGGSDGTGWLLVGVAVGATGLIALAWKRWSPLRSG